MSEAFKLFEQPIAGLEHAFSSYKEARDALKELAEGERLHLQRESNNRFDASATMLVWPRKDGTMRHLGYVPRAFAVAVAALLDNGYELEARVEDIMVKKRSATFSVWMHPATISVVGDNEGT